MSYRLIIGFYLLVEIHIIYVPSERCIVIYLLMN